MSRDFVNSSLFSKSSCRGSKKIDLDKTVNKLLVNQWVFDIRTTPAIKLSDLKLHRRPPETNGSTHSGAVSWCTIAHPWISYSVLKREKKNFSLVSSLVEPGTRTPGVMVGGHVAGFVNLCVCGSNFACPCCKGGWMRAYRFPGMVDPHLKWVDVGVVGET